MFGLLNINKPAGVTSRDVVNQIQRLVRPAKIGHAGTLDPLASGVLVLCLGKATRLIPYVQRMRKRYRGTFLLGRESDTEDIEGHVHEISGAKQPTRQNIEYVLPEFVGTIQQRPPAYSALKVAGKRAYALAREGQTVELAARPITVYELSILNYEYPELVLDIECGSGTYVRSLGRDLAQRLGTSAVMGNLVRTGIGCFPLEEAVSPEAVTSQCLPQLLLPASTAVSNLPRVVLDSEEAQRTAQGLSIDNHFDIDLASQAEVAAVDEDNRLLAILISRHGGLGPLRNFNDSA